MYSLSMWRDLCYAARQLKRSPGLAVAAGLRGLAADAGDEHPHGAEPRQIMTLVLGRAAWLIGTGIAIGLALALMLAHVLASYLWGVVPRDPLALAAAAVLLALCGLGAAWLPARRAARVSPAAALRTE